MKIELKKTNDWLPTEWSSYTQSFNQVFHKANNIDNFKHKYLNTIDGFSYHSLLKADDKIVGCCTVIPYNYLIYDRIVRIGLVVDVFITEEYRKNPYSLFNMYKKLKKELILSDISLIVAVPNDTAYPYWKNIVKWKDVGFLKYYVLPIRFGNVISTVPGVLNSISLGVTKMILACSFLIRSTEKPATIRIDKSNDIIEKQRYTSNHKKIKIQNLFFSYRIVKEENIDTCYLIDFYNLMKKKKDTFSLSKAIKYISINEKIDLIIFVGQLRFFQTLLFKVPFQKEPKHLYFMADILNDKKISDSNFIFNVSNWDFGLFNYDVR